MFSGADTSYVQQGNIPVGIDFCIVNASRGNIGPVVGSYYHEQIDTVLARGIDDGHYYFNGPNGSIHDQALFYFQNLYRFTRGKSVVVLDVEATGVIPWTPEQSLEWFTYQSEWLDIPLSTMVIYLNVDLLRHFGARWEPLVHAGIRLWLADPSSIGYTAPWPDWTLCQWGTVGGIDRNWSRLKLSDIAKLPTPVPPIPFYKTKKRKTMFGFIRNPAGTIAIVYGDGPNAGKGRPMHAGEWATYAQQGYAAVQLSDAQFNEIPMLPRVDA